MNSQDPQNAQQQDDSQQPIQGEIPVPGAGNPPAGDQGGTPPPPPPTGDEPVEPATSSEPIEPTPPAEEPTKKIVSDEELGIGKVGDFSTSIKIPPHSLKFDEMYFLKLLSGSISLMKEEKMKIVTSIPKLSQYQIDELTRILEEEKRKFAELDDKHQEKVQELQKKQEEDWKYMEMKKEEVSKDKETQDEAEKLRQQIAGGTPPSETSEETTPPPLVN